MITDVTKHEYLFLVIVAIFVILLCVLLFYYNSATNKEQENFIKTLEDEYLNKFN